MKILFKRLTEYGIIIGPDKCQFGTTELSFLGHYVCPEGISPLPTEVDAIVNFVKPEKQRALRRYLGMVNYYHRFIPHCAEKLTPLNNLLTAANEGQHRLSPKSNFELHWTENANVAFTESKQILANATLLVHPQQSAPLNITCDASDFAEFYNNVLIMYGNLCHFLAKSYHQQRHDTALLTENFWQSIVPLDILDITWRVENFMSTLTINL